MLPNKGFLSKLSIFLVGISEVQGMCGRIKLHLIIAKVLKVRSSEKTTNRRCFCWEPLDAFLDKWHPKQNGVNQDF